MYDKAIEVADAKKQAKFSFGFGKDQDESSTRETVEEHFDIGDEMSSGSCINVVGKNVMSLPKKYRKAESSVVYS